MLGQLLPARLIRALGAFRIAEVDMNRKFTELILASLVLLSACGQKQTSSNPSSQNLSQTNTSQPIVSSQNIPISTQQSNQNSNKPKNGYVPDEQTAISIAVAIWIPIYGREKIEGEKPYRAALKNGVWTVTGSLPEGYDGGTAEAQISQDNGCILRVIHDK
jgi:hypothetical protein